MNGSNSLRLVVLVAVLVLWAACSDSSPSFAPAEERGGGAGSAAPEPEGGAPDDQGGSGGFDAGAAGQDPAPAAGAGGGGGVVAGAGGGGAAACDEGGPLRTPEVRRTIPFVLMDPDEGYGGEAAMQAETSGCERIENGWHCEGYVSATEVAGAPTFQFGDGSALVWSDTGGTFVSPPAVDDQGSYWIDYTQRTPQVCPVCGSYSETTLSILSREGGYPRWVGREGSLIEEVDAEFVEMLFGVSARRELSCATEPYVVNCNDVEREIFDHVLETEPEQRIPHATPTRVVTPLGGFDVMWASSEESSVPRERCFDGPDPAHDRGFAANRLPDVFPPCPTPAPESGSDCGTPGQWCSYPDDPDEPCPEACGDECRDLYLCSEDWWYLDPRPGGCGAPDPGCPADMPAELDPCSEEGLRCRYEEALCQCSCGAVPDTPDCGHCQAGTRAWACTTPDPEPCPRVLPRIGQPCDLPSGTDCENYEECLGCGDFSAAPFATCTDGVWEGAHLDCPR